MELCPGGLATADAQWEVAPSSASTVIGWRRDGPSYGCGPVEFGALGNWVTVRCPRDYDSLMRNAGGQWEPGSRRWLVERRRIGPVIRSLERRVDPLFRAVGLTLE